MSQEAVKITAKMSSRMPRQCSAHLSSWWPTLFAGRRTYAIPVCTHAAGRVA